ncbi:efflux RND transporter periplasmic adaptor subunit [Mucilaginibacter myungsuensis]|uniref:Efflux RND transporter periplasmic adaptor subunit n=1 Tax=Mucilaginibacter myungsuensis TaxID=649104 RepID=A0A929L618_9SPHI|nr:efflux RND transporter periplasmic adaptor subunit [Mucilaginibacter myungsuensis]MBE9663856.1 efflux RND transporter periplasmic adaptor subunit [Mucilaginibacter myungsuensis]MDN3598429.1 efflux RND transporter periplasmic adaptor subunit [Mucilaginibacter myungsuensis]
MNKVFILAGLAAIAGLSACHSPKPEATVSKEVCISDSLAKIITIDTAKTSTIKNELTLTGEVASNDNNVVRVFPFSSGQVTDVKVSLGDRVSQGQVLAVMRSADVAGNYTDLSSTNADLAIAKRQMEQAEYLYKNGISSERDYTEAKENYNKAQAANRKVKSALAINGGGNTTENGMLVIKAPRAGYIVEKNVSSGSFIREDNGGSMFTISNMKDVWVWANVFESDISKVKVGYNAAVTTIAYPDKTFQGKVNEVSSILDPDNKVMKIKIALPNPDMLLKPEMFTNVVITNNENAQAVSIPSKAIVFDSSKNYVVVYNSKCDLKVRQVSVIKTVDGVAYIGNGLQPGDKVISKNQLLLYDALTAE